MWSCLSLCHQYIEKWFKAVDTFMQMRPDGVHARRRAGGGGHSTFKWSGCAAGGLKTGPCLKPLGARKIYPVLIHLTKDFLTKNPL